MLHFRHWSRRLQVAICSYREVPARTCLTSVVASWEGRKADIHGDIGSTLLPVPVVGRPEDRHCRDRVCARTTNRVVKSIAGRQQPWLRRPNRRPRRHAGPRRRWRPVGRCRLAVCGSWASARMCRARSSTGLSTIRPSTVVTESPAPRTARAHRTSSAEGANPSVTGRSWYGLTQSLPVKPSRRAWAMSAESASMSRTAAVTPSMGGEMPAAAEARPVWSVRGPGPCDRPGRRRAGWPGRRCRRRHGRRPVWRTPWGAALTE